ncbi:MAG: hypothetical protein ABI175_08650, partial [Polyangiales bacterium]
VDAPKIDSTTVADAPDAAKDTAVADTGTPPIDAPDPCPGKKLCAGTCYDLTLDVDHCGGCDQVCPARAGATRTCVSSTCGFTCNTGFDDCNKVATDGCEVTLATALDHCGACGKVCPAGTGASPACDKGTCGLTCTAGRGDCDGAAGCETDLTTSTSHCGSCSKVCPADATTDATCAGSSCGTTCKSGYASVSGRCTNVAGVFATNAGCSGCGDASSYTSSCTCPSGFSPGAGLLARTDRCSLTASTIQFCESSGPAVGVWGGAFQVDDPVACSLSCRTPNPKTGVCGCPPGYTTQYARALVTNSCGSKIGSSIGLCIQPSVAFDGFGGAYQLDDSVPGGTGCRLSNLRTGTCSCPSGFTASALRTLVDTAGGEIGGQLFTCWR